MAGEHPVHPLGDDLVVSGIDTGERAFLIDHHPDAAGTRRQTAFAIADGHGKGGRDLVALQIDS